MDDIEATYYRITWLYRTPIAAVINGNQDDWNILRKLDADGFILEEAGNVELIDYFTAIARHITDHVEPAKILVIEDDERAGANDFVIKPFKQLELLSRIRRLTGIREPTALK
jgi:CheY-like chemotaxis protein